MKRFIIPLFTFTFTFAFSFLSASAVTATKEYVDRQDGATLQAAKDYTDTHGGGVNTNTLREIVGPMIDAATNAIRRVDGAARPLPKYLHALNFSYSYPDAAEEYYRSRGNGITDGGCSSVRSGGLLCRNFDYPFDSRAEFVVKMSAGPNRFASVGIAQVGTNLTEQMVTSGKPEYSRLYKWLPGATVDGINENGVACNINVVDGNPQTSGWHTTGDLHPLAAIRWILDNATNAQHGAEYIAANIRFPSGWTQNFHYMIADETSTYIVENGEAYTVPSASSPTGALPALTNFRLYGDPKDTTGEGQERYIALTNGANITSQWWTLTYTSTGYRASDLQGITGETLTQLFNYWENNPRESHRGEIFGTMTWWQTVHTSVYDLTTRVLRVAVQETDDWYVFQVPSSGAKIDAYTKAETDAKIAEKREKTDRAVYEVVRTENTDWTWTSDNAELVTALNSAGTKPAFTTTIFPNAWLCTQPPPIYSIHPDSRPDQSASDTSVRIYFDGGADVYSATATRPRYMDETFGPSTNAVLAAVVTNGTGAVATGDLMKFDANGRLVKATAGTDYADEAAGTDEQVVRGLKTDEGAPYDWAISVHKSDYANEAGTVSSVFWGNISGTPTTLFGYGITDARGREDNTCHKTEFGEWAFSDIDDGITDIEQPVFHEMFWTCAAKINGDRVTFEAPPQGEDDTELSFRFSVPEIVPIDYSFTATRSAVCTDGEKFTTPGYVDGKVSATNPTFSNAVLSVGFSFATNEVTSATYIAATNVLAQLGFDEDVMANLPGGKVYGSLGALLAALAAAVALLRKKTSLLDNEGKATDDFATDLLGKPVAISAMRYGLASTSATVKAADRTVTKVTLGTTAVTVTFPDADENGKTRDFLLRIDAASLATGGSLTITKPTGATIYGDAFPSPEATKQYLVAITETAANEFYVRTIEITIPTEA